MRDPKMNIKFSDSEDLDQLLPEAYNRPGLIRFSARTSYGCSLNFWRICTLLFFLLFVGVSMSWAFHCTVFQKSDSKNNYTLDTSLFLYNSSEVSTKIQELEKILAPGLHVWNHGAVDLNRLKVLLGILLDKKPQDIVVPDTLSSRLMQHMPHFLSRNFEPILADSELLKGFAELLVQRPLRNLSEFVSIAAPRLKSLIDQMEKDRLLRHHHHQQQPNDTLDPKRLKELVGDALRKLDLAPSQSTAADELTTAEELTTATPLGIVDETTSRTDPRSLVSGQP